MRSDLGGRGEPLATPRMGRPAALGLGMALATAALGLGVALSPLFIPSRSWSMDRYQLGKVLEMMPPNGPYWSYGNVVMRDREGDSGMDPVVFPHWVHRARFTCRVCHFELQISLRRGYTGIVRDDCLAGSYCGVCHNGRNAFAVQGKSRQCHRCHMSDPEKVLRPAFESFAAELPSSRYGNGIDWVQAQRDGYINPQRSLGSLPAVQELPAKLKTPLKLGTSSPRSDVTFSHEEHLDELDCSICHPEIFNIKRKGTEIFSMENNLYGMFCGNCHMRVAFPMNLCHKCHPRMRNIRDGY